MRLNCFTRRFPPGPVMWRRLIIAHAYFLAATLSGPGTASAADNSDIEAHVKAAFIYNFARFIEWPAHSGAGPMRIGILGRGDLASPLGEVIRGKSANGRPVEITNIKTVAEADCCSILLIERSESKHSREIVQALAGRPVLTVGDGGNSLRDGVMIVFQTVEESVRFQINQEAAEHAGLKVSSQLLKVAMPGPGKHS